MGQFRIKIKPWWVSDDYAVFKYSTNGWFWRQVRTCEYDILSERYYMKPLIVYYSNAECRLEQFKTLGDVVEYECGERAKMGRLNADVDRELGEVKKSKKRVYGN